MKVYLGDERIELYGNKPKLGEKLQIPFLIPPAFNTRLPLRKKAIDKGLVIISTLPNIKSNACSAQILNLEMEIKARKIKAKIFHVACDCPEHWEEVRSIHPFLRAKGFTLKNASKEDSESFRNSFGIGVHGSSRIAHGLFAFQDGKVIASYIPRQQYGIPNIKKFLNGLTL